MSIAEIKDAATNVVTDMQEQLRQLESLTFELRSQVSTFSENPSEREDFALGVSNLWESIMTLRCMLMDMESDVEAVDVRYVLSRKYRRAIVLRQMSP